jgi:uncharacterized membrane protein
VSVSEPIFVNIFPSTTVAGSTIHVTVSAADNVGVDSVTVDDNPLTKTGDIWEGDITVPSDASPGDYEINIHAEDAAENAVESTISYTVIALREGGASASVVPRSSIATPDSIVHLVIKVRNTENVDDTFLVHINVSDLPASYQADLTWFNWTEKEVQVRSGEEVELPIEVAIPSDASGYKAFRAKVNSLTWKPYAYDTGYIKVT